MVRATKTVGVSWEAHARLRKIANEDNRTIGEVITFLVNKREIERFWDGVSEDLARFRADKADYQRYRDEFAEWDNQATRSLAKEPPFYVEDSGGL